MSDQSESQSVESSQNDGANRARAPIWRFFSKVDKDLAKCNTCDKPCSTKKGTTTNMSQHIFSHHAKPEGDELRKLITARKCGNQDASGSSAETASTSSPSISATPVPPLDPKKQKHLEREVAIFLATEALPYNLVERQGLQRLMHNLVPGFKLPTRRELTNILIPDLMEKTKIVIKRQLKAASDVALTTDLWTSSNGNQFLGLTGHFIDENFYQQSCCLACLPFNESHTADLIRDALEEVLESWELQKSKCTCFTTDSGANIKKAIDLLGIKQISCFDHTIQLGVEIVLNSPTIKEGIAKCKKIGGIFNMSCNARRMLQSKKQENGKEAVKMLPSTCKTRWWSVTRLIPTVTEQIPVISDILVDLPKGDQYLDDVPTPPEIGKLRKLTESLKSIKFISDEMAGEKYPTASAILPLVYDMKPDAEESDATTSQPANEDLQSTEDLEGIEDMMLDLESGDVDAEVEPVVVELDEISEKTVLAPIASYLEKYYCSSKTEDSISTNSKTSQRKRRRKTRITVVQRRAREAEALLSVCTYLDPRFSDRLPENLREKARITILGEVLRTSESAEAEGDGPPKPKKKKPSMFRKKVRKPSSREELVQMEMDRFEKVTLEEEDDVHEWWRKNQGAYPRLARVAKKYLAVQATSVAAERTFSTGGRVLSPHRRCLSNEHVEELTFLARNVEYFPSCDAEIR